MRDYFEDNEKLSRFVSECDVIVHLAAMVRGDPQMMFDVNVSLVRQLIASMEKIQHQPHIIFSSSVGEQRDNSYGRSKREGRRILEEWADRNHAKLTCLIIPNVFGPFSKPFYNSVVSTFSYQLIHNLQPTITANTDIGLIDIPSLVKRIYEVITDPLSEPVVTVTPDGTMKVMEILAKLQEFQHLYGDNHIFPSFRNDLEISLFNAYRSLIDLDHFPVVPESHSDHNGNFKELVNERSGGQIFVSAIKPGVTWGNHFHLQRIERVCVVKGDALLQIRKIGFDNIIRYELKGSDPGFVDIPVWCTHSITNTGKNDLITIFWIYELFEGKNPDTYAENV